jgi:hypothetical protein
MEFSCKNCTHFEKEIGKDKSNQKECKKVSKEIPYKKKKSKGKNLLKKYSREYEGEKSFEHRRRKKSFLIIGKI